MTPSATSTIHGSGFCAHLIRSRRKTLGIVIRRGSVQVRAPQKLALASIVAFVEQKTPWIQTVLERHSQQPAPLQRCFEDGETLYYLGQKKTLRLLAGSAHRVQLLEDELWVQRRNLGTEQARRRQLADWYRQQAEVYFTQRCDYFAERLGLQPRALKVRLYKSRWGSCTQSGAVHFNWLLMMAPPAVLDYVVVHELCHLRYFDHSPAFWALVNKAMPDYKTHTAWLKQQSILYW